MRVGIVGCGVIGAAIAFELSQFPEYQITVWDRRSLQAWEATGAALGILMAALSPKFKGRHLQLRLASLQGYETWIPRLETLGGSPLPYNRQGILKLCFQRDELRQWQAIQQIRRQQGFELEILQKEEFQDRYPQWKQAHLLADPQPVVGAIYSPQDRQIDPIALTEALIKAAQLQGATLCFNTQVEQLRHDQTSVTPGVTHVCTLGQDYPVDWLIIAAGLGSRALTQSLNQRLALQPVLGQAMRLRRRHPIALPRPVVYGGQTHIVPLSQTDLWIGATVEFPANDLSPDLFQPNPDQLQTLYQQAISLDPSLASAAVLNKWSGKRPRPQNQPAPIIEPLAGYRNVILATGHYRNGILLAPITAQKVRQLMTAST
ncbi:MAG: FAD-binding oxidoreductase [Acaryochloridaceae cyanobacterium SU_2_1]|nr:FAD-binding oxidoreductase [Acaryochloridaceae cyanobacterium SU_2_1]